MRGGFLITRAKKAREKGAAEPQEGFDELGSLLFVEADERKSLACDQVTTNQNHSQHAVCELIRKTAVKAFRHEIGRQRSTSTRGEGYNERPEYDIFQWNLFRLSFETGSQKFERYAKSHKIDYGTSMH